MTLFKNLYLQVLIAVVIAVIFGIANPEAAQAMKPLGDGFIKLIKMLIGPIIFCTIVLGIVGMEDAKELGKLGIKMLIYFEVLTTFALIIGYVIAHLVKPGSGMNIEASTLSTEGLSQYVKTASESNVIDFILNIIPTTIFSAFTNGEILPVLFIAIIFGFALSALEKQSTTIISGIEQLSHILFKIVSIIMRLAPIGAFGAMSYTIGKYGIASLGNLAFLILCFYITCFLFVFLILGLITKICGINIWNLLKYIKEEIFLVLGTSSSESALPSMMKKLENLGCKKSVVGVVVPAGYSFNLDGTCIYFTMAIIFLSQALNINLSFQQELGVILLLLLTSKGAAGVAGSGFITLAATLSATNSLPLAALTLILGIDRFMSEARAITNLIGNSVATIAISKWEKALDKKKVKEVLDNL
ncbi:MAG: Sodium:dicarboxylate symporter [Rickettsiaceae bacterium]|jgi:aerobic C4-dicarboxylate transport protein|nr:Sodium:dicarboxylate symporter [Rickettsiaceae bacterium]